MPFWTDVVDAVSAILFGLAAAFGGNMGLAIGFLSLTFRLALLPITLRVAYRSMEVRAALKRLEPQLSSIRARYKADPRRVWEETAKLHQRHGIKVVDGWSFVGTLAQVPLFLALFSAVRRGLSSTGRFLWIRDLMKPDPLLACTCAALTGLSAAISPNGAEQQRVVTVALPTVLTLFFLWRMAAGVTIYTFASGLVGLIQSVLVRRRFLKQATEII
jgi:YidC/Oxa1 family membrane protein insertase